MVEVLAGAVLLDALLLEVELPSDEVVWLDVVLDDSGAVALELELVLLVVLLDEVVEVDEVDEVDDAEELLLVVECDELLEELLVELDVVLEVVECVVELVLEVLVVVVPGHS